MALGAALVSSSGVSSLAVLGGSTATVEPSAPHHLSSFADAGDPFHVGSAVEDLVDENAEGGRALFDAKRCLELVGGASAAHASDEQIAEGRAGREQGVGVAAHRAFAQNQSRIHRSSSSMS